MRWYRAELTSGDEQLELLLGPDPSKNEIEDFFKTDESRFPLPASLKGSEHHPLIQKPFRFTTPTPEKNAKYLRFKPAGTFTSGIYMAADHLTSLKERIHSILRVSGDLDISIYTFELEFIPEAIKNVFDVNSRTEEEKSILCHDSNYELCNSLFKTLAIGIDRKPLCNVVEYTSLRNPPRLNNLVYDIFLLRNEAWSISSLRVLKVADTVTILDAFGIEKYRYSIK